MLNKKQSNFGGFRKVQPNPNGFRQVIGFFSNVTKLDSMTWRNHLACAGLIPWLVVCSLHVSLVFATVL